MKRIMCKVYTSFKEVSRAYNKIRKELIDLGVLWDGAKLEVLSPEGGRPLGGFRLREPGRAGGRRFLRDPRP